MEFILVMTIVLKLVHVASQPILIVEVGLDKHLRLRLGELARVHALLLLDADLVQVLVDHRLRHLPLQSEAFVVKLLLYGHNLRVFKCELAKACAGDLIGLSKNG